MNSDINLASLDLWADHFLEKLEPQSQATVLALSGNLGAGKTTLTQSIGCRLGITETITSPTFVIQKEYVVENHQWIRRMIHIDAYRLEHKKELEYLGWDDLVSDPHNFIIIEWPEMVSGITFPGFLHRLHITINDNQSRKITHTTSRT